MYSKKNFPEITVFVVVKINSFQCQCQCQCQSQCIARLGYLSLTHSQHILDSVIVSVFKNMIVTTYYTSVVDPIVPRLII